MKDELGGAGIETLAAMWTLHDRRRFYFTTFSYVDESLYGY